MKLAWRNFEPHPELRAPFFAGYGDPGPHGPDFESRRELSCLYAIVGSLTYFAGRSLVDDLARWAGGAAC